MPSRRINDAKRKQLSLYIAASFEDEWREVIAPWIERVLPRAWRRHLGALVVAPTRGHVSALKARLLEAGLSHLGLHFVTTAGLERLLAPGHSESAAAIPSLRLLLAIAGAEISKRTNDLQMLAAKAVARTAGALLRTLDRLERAGWDFAELDLGAFTLVVERFNQLRKEFALSLPAELERQWFESASQSVQARFGELLVTGFDGAHWPYWLLLRSAVAKAEHATVLLKEPGQQLLDADVLWIGAWEDAGGEAERARGAKPNHDDTLFTEEEMRGGPEPVTQFDFLIGTNGSEQAEAIAIQCMRYLAEENCTRLGVIFATAGGLPRLVANALSRLDIPHNDGLGHPAPGIFESDEWRAWIELQRSPHLNRLLKFLNDLVDADTLLGGAITRAEFDYVLRYSFGEVLLDDVNLFHEFCLTRQGGNFQAAARVLKKLLFLPRAATFAEFLEQTDAALSQLQWGAQMREIRNAATSLGGPVQVTFPVALYLRWIEETVRSAGLERGASGDHPYARVQLLSVTQAQNQSWSHVILAGCNEGNWPPAPVGEFAREEEIHAFNQRIRQLNKKAARQGRQGEGHMTIEEGHSLYLGPVEQRAIAIRQFDALIDSRAQAVTIAASLVQEDAPERLWNPSECLTRVYLEQRGEALTEAALKQLQQRTAGLIKNWQAAVRDNNAPAADVQQTIIAFYARRDGSVPAGEYDFALRSEGSHRFVPLLSVSDLEQMVSAPALIWMKRYLAVQAADDLSNPWAAATGKWVHGWLAAMAGPIEDGSFVPLPSPASMDERVCASADDRRALVRKLCDSLGRAVPDWWTSGWLNARYLARHLASKIGRIKDWPWMTTELPVGRDEAVKVTADVALQLRGQIDVVLAKERLTDLADKQLWIVDYKTGSAKELRSSDLHDSLVKGVALQLGLYALALRQLGAATVDATIVSTVVKSASSQLSLADLAPHTNVFADLSEMQRTGVFGMKGEIRPAFGFSLPYPLATLPIDRDILEDRWARTHPNLVLEKEEMETW